jgi:hypothetical protein
MAPARSPQGICHEVLAFMPSREVLKLTGGVGDASSASICHEIVKAFRAQIASGK